MNLSSSSKATLACLLTLLIVLIPAWPYFFSGGLRMDEGMTLLYPELLLRGKLPYRDFETFYGPLNLWILSFAYSLAGIDIYVQRAVGLLYQVALLLGLFLLVRRQGLILSIGTALIAAILLRPIGLCALAWNGGLACVIWSLVVLSSGRPRSLPVAGILGAAALLFRPDLGPAVFLSTLPFLWRRNANERWRYLLGFGVGLIPLAVITVAVGPQEMINNLFIYPVLRTNPGRRIPWECAPQWIQQLIYLHFVAVVLALGAGWLRWRQDPSKTTGPVLLASGLLALSVSAQGLQRMDFLHVLTAFLPSLVCLPWSLATLIERLTAQPLPIRWKCLSVATSVALLGVTASTLLLTYLEKMQAGLSGERGPAALIVEGSRSFPIASELQAGWFRQVITLLKTDSIPGQRLFVGGGDLRRAYVSDTFLYHLTPWLEPATYFLETNPFSANREGSRLANDVASADWLVLNHYWDAIQEPNLSWKLGPNTANEIIWKNFLFYRRIGSIDIYRKRTSPAW